MKLTSLLAPFAFTMLVGNIACAGDDDRFNKEKHHSHHYGKQVAFAVIGDGPYGDDKEAAFDNLIRDINRDRSVKFVLHVGDIKSGGAECSDARLQRRFEQLQKIRSAVIYTPGDNEWTDCHRQSNGGWNPLERLDFLRTLFYPNPNWSTGQQPRRLLTQSRFKGYEKFVENTLFMAGPVAVSSIHVVGSNNNLRPWSGIDPTDSFENPRADRLAEFVQRNAASLHWLEKTFKYAKRRNAAGVFISIHANPNFDLAATETNRAGFNDFLEKLYELSAKYKRPVMLGHGDSHIFRVDKPRFVPWYYNPEATGPDDNEQTPNLTRMEVFGDSEAHWVKITANPRERQVFTVAPRLVSKNLK